MAFRSDDQAIHRVISNLLNSRDPILVLSRYILVAVLVVSGLRWLNAASISLEPEMATRKDFLQDFVMGKAVAHGISPYLPTSELVDQFVGNLPHLVFAHPCPHPPPVALLLAPLAPFSYPTGAAIWFFLEALAIVAIVLMLSQHLKEGRPAWWEIPLIVLAAFSWHPFGQELVLGQLGAPLLLLLVLAWRSLVRGHDIQSGIFLGLSLSIKLFTWPILLFYLITRRWRASLATIASASAVNLIAVLVLGIEPVRYYFFEVSGQVFDSYKSAEYNMSLWTVGWRLFQGTGSPVLKDMHAHPLFDFPYLAQPFSILVVATVLIVGLVLAARARHADTSFGLLTCVAILISPVAWPHYLMQAALPVVIAVRHSMRSGLPGKASLSLLLSCIPLFVPYHGIRDRLLSGSAAEQGPGHFVPFALTLPIFLPVAALFLLMAVLWKLDQHHGDEPAAGSYAEVNTNQAEVLTEP